MVQDDSVNLAAVAVELLAVADFSFPKLSRDEIAVPVIKGQTVGFVANGVQSGFYAFPALEDVAGVGGEGYNVSQRFEVGAFVEEDD